MVYVSVDSPNLGFPYFSFLGEAQCKKPWSKIFDVLFCFLFLFTSFLQPARIETDSIVNHSSAVSCAKIVPKYIPTVKLKRGQSPNILSEMILLGENGHCGGNLKSQISTFAK